MPYKTFKSKKNGYYDLLLEKNLIDKICHTNLLKCAMKSF